MFTVLFAIGRLPGWIAQWREMMHDPESRIGRPRQLYVGAGRARLRPDGGALIDRSCARLGRVARFRYGPDIIERFPAVVGGVIHATGVHNGPTPPRLAAAFRDETLATRTRIGETPLSELPTLAAWRKAFRGFGVDPTQYRSAAEALLRRLTKQGELPSIGTLVDLANLVSIRYALPVAVFDRARDLGRHDRPVRPR